MPWTREFTAFKHRVPGQYFSAYLSQRPSRFPGIQPQIFLVRFYSGLAMKRSGASCTCLCVAHFGGQPIKHAVDILVSIDTTEGFGQLDCFIDDDFIGTLDAVL